MNRPSAWIPNRSTPSTDGLLESLHAEGITVLLIEHDLQAVIEHAERVICLNREIYFDGPSAEFTDSAALARAFGTGAQSLTGGNR